MYNTVFFIVFPSFLVVISANRERFVARRAPSAAARKMATLLPPRAPRVRAMKDR